MILRLSGIIVLCGLMYSVLKIVFPWILPLFICWYVSGERVNLVHLSCLQAEDMLPNTLLNLINEALK